MHASDAHDSKVFHLRNNYRKNTIQIKHREKILKRDNTNLHG